MQTTDFLLLFSKKAVHLDAPTLLSPTDGVYTYDYSPDLTWSAVTNASAYDVQIATDSGFSTIVSSGSVAGTTYTPSPDLSYAAGGFYWRVRATLGAFTSDWSATRTFRLYLLDVGFNTVDAAPIANPYVGELDSFATSDPDSALGVTGGFAVLTTPTNAGTPRMLSTTTFTRTLGRAVLGVIRPGGTDIVMAFGWTGAAGTTISIGIYFVQTNEIRIRENGGNVNTVGAFIAGYNYYLAVTMRSTGAHIQILGGLYADWTELFVCTSISTDMKGGWTGISSAGVNGALFDYVRVADLPAPFVTSDYALATFNQTSNSESLGSEKLTDGAVENWGSSTDLTSWTESLAGTSTVNREGSVTHGGSFALRYDIDGSNSDANAAQTLSNANGDLIEITYWTKASTTAKSARVDLGANQGPTHTLTTTYVQFTELLRALAANVALTPRRVTGTSASIYFDDHSVKVITPATAEVMHPDSMLAIEFSVSSPAASAGAYICYRTAAPGEEFYNGFVAWIKRNDTASNYDVGIDVYVNGTKSSVIATVTSVGTPDTFVVSCYGDKHDLYTGASGTFTHRGSTTTNTSFLNATGANRVWNTGFTISRFMAHPRRQSAATMALLNAAHGITLPTYIAQAEFRTNAAAPLSSSITQEKGTLKKGADSSNLGSLTNSRFRISGLSPSNFVDPYYYIDDNGNGFARATGKALFIQVEMRVNGTRPVMFGWDTGGPTIGGNGNQVLGAYFPAGSPFTAALGTAVVALGATNWTIGLYNFVFVLFSTGGEIWGKGGILGTTWTRLWTEHSSSSAATLWPVFRGVNTTEADFDIVRILDLSATYTSDYALATIRDTTLASGDTFTGTADGEHTFEFTVGSPSANDEIAVLEFRRQDSSNMHRMILKRNAGGTNNDLQIRTVTAGTPATPSGWTDVTSVGSIVEMKVIAYGNTLDFYTRTGTTWTKRGATLTNSSFNTQAGLAISAVASTALTAVNSSPRTSTTLAAIFDQVGYAN